MGTEITALIILPGIGIFVWLCYKSLVGTPRARSMYLVALLIGLSLGVRGMVNSYLPTIPANWNTQFLVGWFLTCASFWLIITAAFAALGLFLIGKILGNDANSNAS